MFRRKSFLATTLILIAAPALAQNPVVPSGSTIAPPPQPFTLGIAAASTANDRPVTSASADSSAHGTSGTLLAANQGSGRLRASTR